MPPNPIGLIIHAGTGSYPKSLERAKRIRERLENICNRGYQYLKNHSAVQTAVEITRWLEDWPETNAGIGSVLQSDGVARLSASVMDGHLMRFSGIINIEKVKNPILVAEKLQAENDRILASSGALAFAKQKCFKRGLPPFDKKFLKDFRKRGQTPFRGYGTVGVCALDRFGHLAAATSTGGKGMELVGRVSDSAIPPGNYANSYAAVSATGNGEDIIEESLASTIAMRATDRKNLKASFQKMFKAAGKRNRKFAAIGLDRNGKSYWSKTTEILYYAYKTNSKVEIFSL